MSHYSLAHKTVELEKWAQKMALVLSKKFRNSGTYPVLTYRGMSGTVTATLLQLAVLKLPKAKRINFGTLYVRKYNENTNGQHRTEGNYFRVVDNPLNSDGYRSRGEPVFVAVDDFICSGETLAELARGFAYEYDLTGEFRLNENSYVALTGSNWDANDAGWLESDRTKLHPIVSYHEKANGTRVGIIGKLAPLNEWLGQLAGKEYSPKTSYRGWEDAKCRKRSAAIRRKRKKEQDSSVEVLDVTSTCNGITITVKV